MGAVVGGNGEGVGIDVGESVDHQGFVGLSVRSWSVGRARTTDREPGSEAEYTQTRKTMNLE